MEYAIETLKIELHKIIEAQRVQEKYSVYPEYIYEDFGFLKKRAEIEEAISILQESNKGLEE